MNKIDLSKTITPKSDQLNADDLMSGERIIKITKVKTASDPKQPTLIYFEGDNNKPWKPCLTMRRALLLIWGDDGNKYVGQSLKLYRDESVIMAGEKVGGIRFTYMTGIKEDVKLILTVGKARKRAFVFKPLETNLPAELSESAYQDWVCKMDEAGNMDELNSIGTEISKANYDESGKSKLGNHFRVTMEKVRDK